MDIMIAISVDFHRSADDFFFFFFSNVLNENIVVIIIVLVLYNIFKFCTGGCTV